MKNRKWFFRLLTLVLLSLALLAGCGSNGDDNPDDYPISGADWRTTGIVRDSGTITRDGENTDVLVCINKADATFYYDSEDQTLFDFVDYPIPFESGVWDLFRGIDFADLNGDGNSDVTMRFDDGGSEIVLVWYWDAESVTFVYQPEESSTGGRKTAEEIYHELLERFYALVSDPGSYDTAEAGETGVLESAKGLGEDALNGMGYLIEDLSGDGVPELAVGTLREYGGEVNALYTLVDNEPELVFEGWSRNSCIYVDAYVGGSSCFYNHGSSSAVESSQGVFTLSRNGREREWRWFYFTCAEDGDQDNVTLYANTTGSWDPEESEVAYETPDEYFELFSVPVVERVKSSFWAIDCTESGLYLTPFSAWGDLDTDDGNAAPVLMCDALPFTNMETLQSEINDDGTYYYMDVTDVTEAGQIFVVNTAMQRHWEYDVQTLEDYLADCALTLGNADTYDFLTVEENDAYTGKMSYPVYVVTYTAGGNEDAREWIIFAMDTDRYTYLYGLCATLDAADEMKSVYQDIFAGLYLSDGE